MTSVGTVACFVILVIVVALAIVVPLAPLIDCPLGIGSGHTGPEHLRCELCKHTGKLTLLHAAKLLWIHRGHWPQSC